MSRRRRRLLFCMEMAAVEDVGSVSAAGVMTVMMMHLSFHFVMS